MSAGASSRAEGAHRTRLALTSLAVAGALAGCAGTRADSTEEILEAARVPAAPVANPTARPDAAAPDASGTSGPAPSAPASWTLDAVLAEIARANATLGAARARLEEARAAKREAVATYYPELSLGFDYLSTDNPAQAFAVLLNQEELTLGPGFDPTPGSTDNWRKEVRLDWPLFAPGRREARHAALAGEEAAQLAAEAVERRLLNAGLQAWLGLGAARALADVAHESVAVVETRLEETRLRHAEGAALRSDVLRLEVRLAAARQDAARAELAVRGAESALNHLMGRGAGEPLSIEDDDPAALAIGATLPDELEALVALAETERRDLEATAHRVRALGLQRSATGARRLPQLQAFATYDVDGPDPAVDWDLDSYTVGVGLRLPLSARTGARVRQAEATERVAREELRELALAVTQEVRDAWEALGVAEETLALSEAAVGAAEEAYRIVAEAQDAGGATVTDVLEAEDARKAARVRAVAARAGVNIARAKLVAATGGVR